MRSRQSSVDPFSNTISRVASNRRERIRRLGKALLQARLELLEERYEDPDDDLEPKMLAYFKQRGWDDDPMYSQPNITLEEFLKRYAHLQDMYSSDV